MPRRMMLGNNQQSEGRLGQINTSAKGRTKQASSRTNQVQVRQALRKRRSSAYLDALARLDQLANIQNPAELQRVKDAVAAEFGSEVLRIPGFPSLVGIVAPCYLGGTFDVHTLDLALNIVHHYHSNEALPPELTKARSLAASRRYAFIEVYDSYCCCIEGNGVATIIDD